MPALTPLITNVWEKLSTSLWFLPSLFVIGAVLLSWLMLSSSESGSAVWWLHSGSARDAANLLSSLLTAMITMATLAISITIVVLTLAAAHLGPRLIRSFMADKRTQIVLGLFLATIVYLILVLRVLDGETRDGVPHLAITIGTLLVVLSIVLLLFFIHHLARSIIADNVIHRVGTELDKAVREMMPASSAGASDGDFSIPGGGASFSVSSGGYIQTVDYAGLVECASTANVVVKLRFRPGHHVLPGGSHGSVHPESALTPELEKAICRNVICGDERTAAQDLEFSVRQLVEIAVRALSPGVNDPFTAITAIDRLSASLAHALHRDSPSGYWSDDCGNVRVIGPVTSFSGLLAAAFDQIRQAGEGHPAVLIRLLEKLGQLSEQAGQNEHHVIREQVNLVMAAAKRSIPDASDLEVACDREETLSRRPNAAVGLDRN